MKLLDLERWRSFKDRLFSSQRFHSAALSFPFSRPIARRYATSLFDICAGFVYSQVLYAAVRLDLFRKLAEGPQTALKIAQQIQLPSDRTETLLNACVALRLLERRSGNRFGLAALGAAVLANPEVEAMVRHHALLYADLLDPVRLIEGGSDGTRLSAFWSYAHADVPSDLSPLDVSEFSRLMGITQTSIAQATLDAYPLGKHRCLLDIGGGEGVFLTAALQRTHGLRGLLFDLPAVADRAKLALSQAGLDGRFECFGGNFFAAKLPKGADIATLVRVAFDHDDAHVLILLKAIFESLEKPGRILIAEPISDPDNPSRVSSAYFAFYLMAMGHGRARTVNEISKLLITAGFSNCRVVKVPSSVILTLVIADAH